MPTESAPPASRRALLPAVAGLALVSTLVALLGAPAARALRYERAAVQAGEAWRLLTAHVVHLGPLHLALNVAALALVALLLGDQYRPREWLAIALVSALGVGLGLLLAAPSIAWYVGLSGLTHGLVAAGALALVTRHRVAGLAWLLALAAKLAGEQLLGPWPGSRALIGGATVVDAHLHGALAGALAAGLCGACARLHLGHAR